MLAETAEREGHTEDEVSDEVADVMKEHEDDDSEA